MVLKQKILAWTFWEFSFLKNKHRFAIELLLAKDSWEIEIYICPFVM